MNLIQALLNPIAYPHPVDNIELIETHISWVLLTGKYAYKIKKNIQFDFLDFSSLEKRHFYCEEELRLNRRLAPELYLQVVPITGTQEQPQINGNGEIMEYAVQMQQFASNQLLSDLADQGQLSASMIDRLADLTADFHLHASTDTSGSRYGTAAEIHHWFSGNFAHIRPFVKNEKSRRQLMHLEQWGEQALLKNTPLMQQRKQQGFIRECHGDLHLGNIALIHEKVTPFDCIEFNQGLHWIDVMSEVAFVVMDLQQRSFPAFACRFLNRYLSHTGDYQGLALLPYYLVYRALVRSKVAFLRWQQHKNPQDLREAKSYMNLAENFSKPKPQLLIMTHGYSGSGKSTFSAILAEKLDLIHLRSDVERQRIFTTSKHVMGTAVNQGDYTADKIQLVYQRLADLAAAMITAGFSVLIDAAFLQTWQRALFQQLVQDRRVKDRQVKLLILDFHAPEAELKQRILQRQKLGKDASEATITVLEHQLKVAQPLTATELENTIAIDTCAEDALEKLMAASPFRNRQPSI